MVVLGGGSRVWMDSVCVKRQAAELDSWTRAGGRDAQSVCAVGLRVYLGCVLGMLCAGRDCGWAASERELTNL